MMHLSLKSKRNCLSLLSTRLFLKKLFLSYSKKWKKKIKKILLFFLNNFLYIY